jgi:LmbE family N-acetylglucosaminyl deacetylase
MDSEICENNPISFSTDQTLKNVIEKINNTCQDNQYEYYMKLKGDQVTIEPFSKSEIISGRKELLKLTHRYNFPKDKIEKRRLEILEDSNIAVFSPHPDDEILGASGLLHHCFVNKIKIKVVYMTSGKTAGDPFLRKREALNGIKILGGCEDNVSFINMPFYDRKDRLITNDDYDYINDVINKLKPSDVFICADIFDPNNTHYKCYEILINLLNKFEFNNVNKYFYYSVWYWPKENEYNYFLPYDYETYKMKIYAMLEHKSQLLNDFMGNDPRPFYQRATTRDKEFAKLNQGDFCEIYYKLN